MNSNSQQMAPFHCWRIHQYLSVNIKTCQTECKHADLKYQCHPSYSASCTEVDPDDTPVNEPLIWTRWDWAATAVLAPLTGLCWAFYAGRKKKRPSLPQLCCYWPAEGKKRVDKWIRFISGADWLQYAKCQRSHSLLDYTPRISFRLEVRQTVCLQVRRNFKWKVSRILCIKRQGCRWHCFNLTLQITRTAMHAACFN